MLPGQAPNTGNGKLRYAVPAIAKKQ